MEWMWEPFHVGLGPQPFHLDIICSLAVTQEISQLLKFGAYKYGYSWVMVDPSALPQHMNSLKHLVYVWSGCGNHSMWVWGLNNPPLHHLWPLSVTCEIIQLLPNFCANKCGSSSMIVDPSAHPQHMNGLKHLVYI